jgi:hypothetical protein
MKIGNILLEFANLSKDRKLKWEPTSRMAMFGTFYKDIFVCIDQRSFTDDSFEITIFNQAGDIDDRKTFLKEDTDYENVKSLYQIILQNDNALQVKYEEARRLYTEEEQRKEKLNITMSKLNKRLLSDDDMEKLTVKENPSFGYVEDKDSKFEMPPLVQIPTTEGYTALNEAEVMIIAAPGATGKTVLSKYLCHRYDFLRLDLGVFGPVGSNSLLGVFADNFESMTDLVNMSVNLQQGKTSMVIDGLDEAYVKTTEEAYEGFLQDVIKLAKGGKGMSFILLGRTKVVEDTCICLEDAGVKVILVQIEPFTKQKAKSFIDKQQETDAYRKQSKQYEQVRDYIIESIQGFFRNESDIKQQLYERFIGYSPVLLAISRLLNENGNYYELYSSLQESQKRNVELVVNIVERIMERERDKVRELVRNELMHNRPLEFQEGIIPKMLGLKEQCVRLLAYVQRQEMEYKISDDDAFNLKYNEKISEWIEDHPLLDKVRHGFQNVVFESYVLAYLMNLNGKENDVLAYLNQGRGPSYMLFDIFRLLNKNGYVDYRYVKFLYISYTALDRTSSTIANILRNGEMQINETDASNDDVAVCTVNFSHGDSEDVVFQTNIPRDEPFMMTSHVSNIYIDAQIAVELAGNKVELVGPVQVTCNKVIVTAGEVIFALQGKNNGFYAYTDVFCNEFKGILPDGNIPKLVNKTRIGNILWISSGNKLSFPFSDFHHDYFEPLRKDPQMMDKYQKLRRLLLLFRANGRGGLARVKSKIESRISNVEIGKKVLQALINADVIYEQDTFYFINTEKMNEVLEASYSDIQKCKISTLTMAFLRAIN